MSENDPWKKVGTYAADICLDDGDLIDVDVCLRTEVNAARAAEAALNQQALERLTRQAQDISVTLGEAGCRAMPIVDGVRWLVDHNLQLRASLAAVEAERDAERQRWMDARAREIEHSIRADRAEAERDRLKAALSQITALDFEKFNGRHNFYSGAVMFVKAWLLAYAALTPQGQSTDGETR